jgi:hypothetical protein
MHPWYMDTVLHSRALHSGVRGPGKWPHYRPLPHVTAVGEGEYYKVLEGMGSPTPPSWLMDCMAPDWPKATLWSGSFQIDDTMFRKFKYENCGNCGLV